MKNSYLFIAVTTVTSLVLSLGSTDSLCAQKTAENQSQQSAAELSDDEFLQQVEQIRDASDEKENLKAIGGLKSKKKESDFVIGGDGPIENDPNGIGTLPFIDDEEIIEDGSPKSFLDRFLDSDFSSPTAFFQDPDGVDADNFIDPERFSDDFHSPYKIYKQRDMVYSLVAGSSDQLQWHSFKGDAYLRPDENSGWTWMINYHFLSGPTSIHLPPRLFDFVGGYQQRGKMSNFLSYDVAASVGVYSDFEGSAREGVRFVSHATGILHINSQFDFVFGADYQDRDDYRLIPVLGFSYRSLRRPWLRYDLVFPNPVIRIAMDKESEIYFAGRLGGGSWAIEFPDTSEDILTYRDYRIVAGFKRTKERKSNSLELGFANSRTIEFRNRPDKMSLEDSFFLQYSWVR